MVFNLTGTDPLGLDPVTARQYGRRLTCRKVSTINALGDEMQTAYDAHGNVIAESGATYPVRYAYDSQGRRVAMNRSGDEWDMTRWTYDPATGLCTSKIYEDGSVVTYEYTPDGLLETTRTADVQEVVAARTAAERARGVGKRGWITYEAERNQYFPAQNLARVKEIAAMLPAKAEAAGAPWRYRAEWDALANTKEGKKRIETSRKISRGPGTADRLDETTPPPLLHHWGQTL